MGKIMSATNPHLKWETHSKPGSVLIKLLLQTKFFQSLIKINNVKLYGRMNKV